MKIMSEQNNLSNDVSAQNSAPTTPGQAEGTEQPEKQSVTSPAPTQPDQAEGEDDDAGPSRNS
jgi:hypothetical protein